MKNMAIQFLEERQECLDDYDGLCGELVDAIMHWLGEDKVRILYIKPRHCSIDLALGDRRWSYHMIPVIGGLVHDAWQPHLVMSVDEYVLHAFPGQIFTYEYPAEMNCHE